MNRSRLTEEKKRTMFRIKTITALAGLLCVFGAAITSCSDGTSTSTSTEPTTTDVTEEPYSEEQSSAEGEEESTTGEEDAEISVDNSVYDYNLTIGVKDTSKEWTSKRVQECLTSNGYTNVTFEIIDFNGDSPSITDWKEGPDVYSFSSYSMMTLKASDALSKVPEDNASDIYESLGEKLYKSTLLGDECYSYPYETTSGYFMYYNRKLVDESKVNSLDTLLTSLDEHGVKLLWQAGEGFLASGILTSFGATYKAVLNEAGNAVTGFEADFDTDRGYMGALALKQIVTSDLIKTGTEDSIATVPPTASNGYGAVISGAWDLEYFLESVGEEDLGAVKLPEITVSNTTSNTGSLAYHRMWGVNNKITAGDEARYELDHLIAGYLAGEESQVSGYEVNGTVPVSPAAAEKIEDSIAYKALVSQNQYSMTQTEVPETLYDSANDLYLKLKGGTISTESEIRAYMEEFNQSVETL